MKNLHLDKSEILKRKNITKAMIYMAMSVLIMSCTHSSEKSKSVAHEIQTERAQIEFNSIGKNNYAVIWNWETDDATFVNQHIVRQSDELASLWKDGIVQDAYFNADPIESQLENYPKISFYVKAVNKEEAASIMDEMIFVKEGISSYTIIPVGTKWLDRQSDVINTKGVTKSFVSVWTTISVSNHENADEILKKQNDTIISLWKKGIIENVYFDMEGEFAKNEKTDFVMYVNSNSEEEVRNILDELPFSINGMATYKLYPVGTFWMGEYEDYK